MRRLQRNRQGQLMIEAVLLMVLIIALFTVLTKYVREKKLITDLVAGPWAKVAGMTEYGVWSEPANDTRKKHPNTFSRFYTPAE